MIRHTVTCYRGNESFVFRAPLADLIGKKSDEIFFTSGGTEGDNWVIKGVALKNGSVWQAHHRISH